jgi:hypothetical protein
MKIDSENIKRKILRGIENFNFHKNRKIVFAASGALLLLILLSSFLFSSVSNTANPDLPFTIPSYGMLKSLDEAMDDDSLLDERVKRLISYDPAYLFVNYRQINGEVAEILFLWSGLKTEELQNLDSRRAVNLFLRRTHALPDNVPVDGNPVLGERPWPTLFNRFKSRLLMLGQGHSIYTGRAYYDSIKDKMVVEGTLSPEFVQTFAAFVATQPESKRKSYVNNFLVFIDETKGLRNLTDKEKDLIRALN